MVKNTKQKMKNGSKGVWPRSRDLIFIFCETFNIFGMEGRKLKFSTQIDRKGY